MTKNRYEVTGIRMEDERKFYGNCISYDIVSAIQLFRDNGYSVHTVQSRTQVHKDEKTGIKEVKPYVFDEYKSHKVITKRNPKAIDDIYTLEDAKKVISMLVGNVYLNSKIYQMERDVKAILNGNEEKDNLTLLGGISGKNMNYTDIINYVMNNIVDEKDIHVELNENARLHVFVEKLGEVDWYKINSELLNNGIFVVESTMSASDLKDLKRAVGVSWIHLIQLTKEMTN